MTFAMREYLKGMLEFPVGFRKETVATPATNNLFDVSDSPTLEKNRADDFRTRVAKGLFPFQRARRDIRTTVALPMHSREAAE
jgi:hypothetical protein